MIPHPLRSRWIFTLVHVGPHTCPQQVLCSLWRAPFDLYPHPLPPRPLSNYVTSFGWVICSSVFKKYASFFVCFLFLQKLSIYPFICASFHAKLCFYVLSVLLCHLLLHRGVTKYHKFRAFSHPNLLAQPKGGSFFLKLEPLCYRFAFSILPWILPPKRTRFDQQLQGAWKQILL